MEGVPQQNTAGECDLLAVEVLPSSSGCIIFEIESEWCDNRRSGMQDANKGIEFWTFGDELDLSFHARCWIYQLSCSCFVPERAPNEVWGIRFWPCQLMCSICRICKLSEGI